MKGLIYAGVLAGCLALALGAQGAGSAPPPPYVGLVITATDGAGHMRTARLTCTGSRFVATGFLSLRPRAACVAARRLGPWLASRPPAERICTEIYGGPDTARVRGRVGRRLIDRRFSRRDGCEIADWERARLLLPRPVGVSPA